MLGDNDHGSTDSRTLGPRVVLAVVRCRLLAPRPGGSAGRSRDAAQVLTSDARTGVPFVDRLERREVA